MKKITHLTPEQRKLILDKIDKQNKMILSTDPINFELAKQAVIKLYELSGLKKPRKITKILSAMELKLNDRYPKTIVLNVVNSSIIKAFRTFDNTVGNTVADMVWNAISNLVNDIIYDANADLNADFAFTYSQCSFYKDVLNIKLPEILNYSEQLNLNSCFYSFYENVAYICDRPKFIKTQTINNRDRLHNTSGPAVQWRDNFKQWFIEGIEVDKQIVMNPKTQTITQINSDENDEIRRIRIEQYGWVKYLENSEAELINSRINERDNQQEQLYEHEESNRFICIDPSTGRKYAIAVPHRIRTCLAAQKYLSHGLDKFAIHRS